MKVQPHDGVIFYMIYCDGRGAPTAIHSTLERAEKEATRLRESGGVTGDIFILSPSHSLKGRKKLSLKAKSEDIEDKPLIPRQFIPSHHWIDSLREQQLKLESHFAHMSYEQSYFGEPEGTVKRVCKELAALVRKIPKRAA